MKKMRNIPLIALAGCVLAGCTAATQGPPEILVDESACASCSMLISEPRYAAAYRVDGIDKTFDDIGCLLAALEEQSRDASVRLWFRDLHDDTWITAQEATFVRAAELRTPMASGIVATANAAETSRLSELSGAQVFESFAALRAAHVRRAHGAREGTDR